MDGSVASPHRQSRKLHLPSSFLVLNASGATSSEFVAHSLHQLTKRSLLMWESPPNNVRLATGGHMAVSGEWCATMPILFRQFAV